MNYFRRMGIVIIVHGIVIYRTAKDVIMELEGDIIDAPSDKTTPREP